MPFPFMAAATLGAAGLSFLGQQSANRANRIAAENQMGFQREMSQHQMNFNAHESFLARTHAERLSSTAYQRAVGDLRAAGLNPILAVSQGGAASPGGSAASMSPQSGASYRSENELESMAASALGYMRAVAEVENAQLTGDLIRAQAANTNLDSAKKAVTNSVMSDVNSAYTQVKESIQGKAHQDNVFDKAGKWIGRNLYELLNPKQNTRSKK
jgi:hypothetical protein